MMDDHQSSVHSIAALLKSSAESDVDSDTNSERKPKKRKSALKQRTLSINRQVKDANSENIDSGTTTSEEEDSRLHKDVAYVTDNGVAGGNNFLQVKPALYQRQISRQPVKEGETNVSGRKVHFSGDTEVVHLEVALGNACSETGPASPKSNESETSTKEKKKTYREYKTKTIIGVLFICIVCGVTLVYHFYNSQDQQYSIGQALLYDEKIHQLVFYNKQQNMVLKGFLGVNLQARKLPMYCHGKWKESSLDVDEMDSSNICLVWNDIAKLTIRHYNKENTTSCYDVSWQGQSLDFQLQDCFDLGNASWYGMGLVYTQTWPLNLHSVGKIPFLTGTIYDDQTLGPVLEPYWLTSNGVSIRVNHTVPLHISLNAPTIHPDNKSQVVTDSRLCLYADFVGTPYHKTPYPHLQYTVCVADDITQVHDSYVASLSGAPPDPPPDAVLTYPVWSMLPYHDGANASQKSVEDYMNGIVGHGYKRSAFVLDSTWQVTPGELKFNKTLFPDPEGMIQNIKSHGFQMALCIDPYINYNSRAFLAAVHQDLLVHSGYVPALTRWWSGDPGRSVAYNIAGVVDMFPDAQAWLGDRLRNLSESYDIDSYYWIGGQMDMQPYFPTFRVNFSSPNEYLLRMAELGANVSKLNLQQSAYRSQHVPGMIRIYGRESSWTGDNSLASVIPTVLTLSILGYPYILPDVIGGNAYKSYPSKELYIRWMELAAFLPTMHFSIPPHEFDLQTVQVAKSMIDLHTMYVAPLIHKLTAANLNTSLSIIRPLWMVAPEDSETYTIDDQFMIGNDVMVAPMLVEGGKERAIYFPPGMWINKLHGNVIQGSKWIESFPIPISKIAYFERKS